MNYRKKDDYLIISNVYLNIISKNEKLYSIISTLMKKYNFTFEKIYKTIENFNKEFSVKENILDKYNSIIYYLSEYSSIKKLDSENVMICLENLLMKDNLSEINYIKLIAYSFKIQKNYTNLDDDYYLNKYFYLLLVKDKLLDYINNFADNQMYSDCDIDKLLVFEEFIDLFTKNNVKTTIDLSKSNDLIKMLFLTIDPVEFFAFEKYINKKNQEKIINDINGLFNRLRPREEKVVRLRYGIGISENKSLVEIGNEFNCTRERIRQIELKGMDHFKNVLYSNKNLQNEIKSFADFIFTFISKDKEYIFAPHIKDFMGLDASEFLFVLDKFVEGYCFNQKYQILYNDQTSISDIISNIINDLEDSYSTEEFNKLPAYLQKIVLNNYKHSLERYVRKGVTASSIIDDVLINVYNSRINVNDPNEYNNFIKYMEDNYKLGKSVSNDHNFRSILNRLNYYPVDQGVYQKVDKLIVLPTELENKIYDYLKSLNNFILFSQILNEFKDELFSVGITNRHYLKTVLDFNLPKELCSTKDYIKPVSIKGSPIDIIKKSFKSFNGVFTIDDIKKVNPTASDFTINVCINQERENGLINLTNKFIYINKDFFTSDEKNSLKKLIKDNIISNNGYVTIKKIYQKIYFNDKDFFNRHKLIENRFILYSILQYFFNKEFYFKRPFIALEEDENITVINKILEYMNTLDLVTDDDLDNFYKRNSMRKIDNNNFYEGIADDYIRLDSDKYIKQDKFVISDDNIKKIGKTVELILSRQKQIDTVNFTGYRILPDIGYTWNKTLFASIINKYFSDKFEVNEIVKNRNREFIIRRIM